jgi:hypothetical protein
VAINTTPTTSIHNIQALYSFTFNTRASNQFQDTFKASNLSKTHSKLQIAPLEPCAPLAHFPCSLVPSAKLSRPLSRPARAPNSSAAVHRSLSSVPRPSLSPRRVRCPGEFRLAISNSGHPSVRPFTLWFVQSALTGALLAQLESAVVDPRLHCLPAILQALLGSHSW